MNYTGKNIEPNLELPRYLYHYTTPKGLLAILQTNKLCLTNIFYLNDSSEFTYTISLVIQELKERKNILIDKGTLTLIDNELLTKYKLIERALNEVLCEMVTESYVFSLSTEGDDLNQWRGYCPKEGGFSIQFDTKKLSSIIDKTKNCDMNKCIYENIRKMELVKLLIDKVGDDMGLFYKELADIASYIKHESFQGEQEHRIIFHGIPDGKGYREGKSMIIPYVEFSPLDESGHLPISKIIVGPTPHIKLSLLTVDSLLKSKGYDIEVEPSKIPYRPL